MLLAFLAYAGLALPALQRIREAQSMAVTHASTLRSSAVSTRIAATTRSSIICWRRAKASGENSTGSGYWGGRAVLHELGSVAPRPDGSSSSIAVSALP